MDSIESMRRQREVLVGKRIRLIKGIAEKENTNDDNMRIIKYAAMSIETLTEFKKRLQKEKVERLSDTATKCFQTLVEKNSLAKKIDINPDTLDVKIVGVDGTELLKSQLSAGEQQMFAVAIVWALALSSGYKAPVIVDAVLIALKVNSAFDLFEMVVFSFSVNPENTETALMTSFAIMEDSSLELNRILIDLVGRIAYLLRSENICCEDFNPWS